MQSAYGYRVYRRADSAVRDKATGSFVEDIARSIGRTFTGMAMQTARHTARLMPPYTKEVTKDDA